MWRSYHLIEWKGTAYNLVSLSFISFGIVGGVIKKLLSMK